MKKIRKVNLVDPSNTSVQLEAFIEVYQDDYGNVWPKYIIHDDTLWRFDNHTIGLTGQYRKDYAVNTIKE